MDEKLQRQLEEQELLKEQQQEEQFQLQPKFLRDFVLKFQEEQQLYTNFLLALRKGSNTVFYNFITERFLLDDSWIFTIGASLMSVENIVRNPRRFIKEEYDVVNVEKVKKINSRTVRHLSSHTQNIQAVTEDNVRPSKVLVAEIDEDLAIYENRFVYALVERVSNFVEKRYKEIRGKSRNFDKTNLKIHSSFRMGHSTFQCDMDVKVKEPSHDVQAAMKLREQLQKLELIRKRLRIIRNTEFCRVMAKAKPVKPPIQKTNMIRMQTDYRNCYQLWLFVSAYNTLGYSVEVTEKNLPVDGDYFDDLTVINGLAVQSLITDGNLRRSYYEKLPAQTLIDRDFKVVQNYKYNADFGADTKKQGEDAVNEYYFHQMRKELIRAVRRNEIEEKKELDLNFRHFYRSIAKINGEMYKDIITSEYEKQPKGRTPIQKKEAAVKNQNVLLRRYHQLAQLQKQELEKTLKLEKREILKLEKLQIDLAKEKKRRLDTIEKNKKKRLKALEKQPRLAQQAADTYERGLRGLESAKQVQKEEEQRLRREEAKRARELKKYQELKEKFDGDQNN